MVTRGQTVSLKIYLGLTKLEDDSSNCKWTSSREIHGHGDTYISLNDTNRVVVYILKLENHSHSILK